MEKHQQTLEKTRIQHEAEMKKMLDERNNSNDVHKNLTLENVDLKRQLDTLTAENAVLNTMNADLVATDQKLVSDLRTEKVDHVALLTDDRTLRAINRRLQSEIKDIQQDLKESEKVFASQLDEFDRKLDTGMKTQIDEAGLKLMLEKATDADRYNTFFRTIRDENPESETYTSSALFLMLESMTGTWKMCVGHGFNDVLVRKLIYDLRLWDTIENAGKYEVEGGQTRYNSKHLRGFTEVFDLKRRPAAVEPAVDAEAAVVGPPAAVEAAVEAEAAVVGPPAAAAVEVEEELAVVEPPTAAAQVEEPIPVGIRARRLPPIKSPEPAAEPAAEPTVAAVAAVESAAATTAAVEAVAEPAAAEVAEPAVDPAVEPAAEPAVDPAAEPAAAAEPAEGTDSVMVHLPPDTIAALGAEFVHFKQQLNDFSGVELELSVVLWNSSTWTNPFVGVFFEQLWEHPMIQELMWYDTFSRKCLWLEMRRCSPQDMLWFLFWKWELIDTHSASDVWRTFVFLKSHAHGDGRGAMLFDILISTVNCPGRRWEDFLGVMRGERQPDA
jgi:hypothetical protein